MMPPLNGEYSRGEKSNELVNSAKAFHACGSVAKSFAACRRRPEGRLVNPEKCLDHANALLNCYHEVKVIPESCKNSYQKTVICLRDGKGSCSNNLQEYVKCEHPVTEKYLNYH